MVKAPASSQCRGFLSTDLMVAMAILGLALLPLTLIVLPQQQVAKTTYERAVVFEILDGELEVLRAGAWRDLPEGAQTYSVKAGSAASLPESDFRLIVAEGRLRLEWHPAATATRKRAVIAREVLLP
jgi:hypothetical protein